MKIMKKLLLAILVITCILNSSDELKAQTVDKLAGAGATFPLPFYNLAFKTYKAEKGTSINYGGIGSGGGIRSLKDKVVNFGGSDAFLSDKELAEMPAEVLHIPTCMGAVVMAYNLDDVQNLKLTADIIKDIYLGNITKWNDSRIASVNAGVKLPDLKITPVYRSDGSGTTFVFSDYMSKASAEWKEKIGTGKSLKINVGIAAKGNPGVAGMVKQTKGSIGYIGSEYAFATKVPSALIQNSNGEFIEATSESISASANVELVPDTRQMITNSSVKGAYPISCFTWMIFYKDQSNTAKTLEEAKATVDLLNWMLSEKAQSLTVKVNYCPLPKAAVELSKKIVAQTNYKGQSL